MPSSCCAVGCQNRKDVQKDLIFYRIPAGKHPFKQNRRKLWLQALRRENWSEEEIKNARLCSAHFISGKASMDYGSPDFVPSIFSYKSTSNVKSGHSKLARYQRKQKRGVERRVTVEPCCEENDTIIAAESLITLHSQVNADEQPPTPVTGTDSMREKVHSDNMELRKELYKLRKENAKLKKKITERQFGFQTLKNVLSTFADSCSGVRSHADSSYNDVSGSGRLSSLSEAVSVSVESSFQYRLVRTAAFPPVIDLSESI